MFVYVYNLPCGYQAIKTISKVLLSARLRRGAAAATVAAAVLGVRRATQELRRRQTLHQASDAARDKFGNNLKI